MFCVKKSSILKMFVLILILQLKFKNNNIIVCGASSSSYFPINISNYQLINNEQDDGIITSVMLPITINSTPNDKNKLRILKIKKII